MDWINNVSSTLLSKSLDGLWARQQAISDNITNYETPGYKKKVVSFEDELAEAINNLKGTKLEKMDTIRKSNIFENIDNVQGLRADGNNVDIEQENIELARNQLQYSMAIRQLNDNFSRLRYAISGGTR
ncbi:flagellar basal body rod protein FlgB [Paludicola sp. MB14-C6]|uniref:flagellar basal body rod protein FlgB n=1 Tax=Paludihabitans sp. MB14-C6 TaxID=3070656 RepID=UPI0027DCFE67|nr:flagellar basal body rod protein FlgB [Paludicola sp. MB14-C6]WMJ24254.1 flagellar basal body rod protein FlgB [Paludicola sp. MB14-C6]